jgi:subtilisin family serine protease
VPGRTFAANDLYSTARPIFRPAGTLCGQSCPPFLLTSWRADIGRCAARATIGVVDTGVDTQHPAFKASRIEAVTVRSEDRAPSGRDHGTGVVSLLVGDASGEYSGAAPGASVVAVDAFHATKSGDIADMYDLVTAIDHLVERRIRVINLSLSGPDNPLLQEVVAKATAKGTVLVAAAGTNEGGTQSGFPARYPGVLAVSAIDSRLRLASGSQRGEHIAFSAPGVGVSVANANKGYSTVRGSSFAAPFVSAAYAMALETVRDGEQATRLIASTAKDLGAPGRDGIFGWGLIQFSALPPC